MKWLAVLLLLPAIVPAATFTVVDPASSNLPPIVLTGFDYEKISKLQEYDSTRAGYARSAVWYLREAIKRMTGKELLVRSQKDISSGIVLTTLAEASDDIRNDHDVQQALRDDGTDSYNNIEAFFIRSETNRLSIIANTSAGMADGVVELLEALDYETLGMGPNWTHVPDFHQRKLEVTLTRAGRPGYYLRAMSAGAQDHGVGTLHKWDAVHDPADERVDVSFGRWMTGSRTLTRSMGLFPGHAMQAFHRAIVKKMAETGRTEGLLAPKILVDLETNRLAASVENKGWLWVNKLDTGTTNSPRAFSSDGTQWKGVDLAETGFSVDPSSPLAREIVLEAMKKRVAALNQAPDDVVIFGTEAEDGVGYRYIGKWSHDANWYPKYLEQEGLKLDKPYPLHGQFGIDQPTEKWDPDSATDQIFAFNNWLLREFDKWIDSLPATSRVTSTGKSKKDMIRCSLYSYALHDVPPQFTLDPRIRVMIADFPEHRGKGKWAQINKYTDALAFHRLLPREPSGFYFILSNAFYTDAGPGLFLPPDSSAASLANYRAYHRAGVKAFTAEMDFNFGKFGLYYYLLTHILWNPSLTNAQVDALRDHWFQSAYGSVWRDMKAVYDAMMPQNFPISGVGFYSQMIHQIDAADRKLDSTKEPDAKRRLDEYKQYWYFGHLLNTGKATPDNREMKEFLWKGQMSYTVAMQMVARSVFKLYDPAIGAGAEFNQGPAHYTTEETAQWWNRMLKDWPVLSVARFSDATLNDGKPARTIDVNDLVAVKEFQSAPMPGFGFFIQAPQNPSFLTVAPRSGDEIGFTYSWNVKPEDARRTDKLSYGVDFWNAQTKDWEQMVDITTATQPTMTVTNERGGPAQSAEVRYRAPRAGVYRFHLGRGGWSSVLTGPGVDWKTGLSSDSHGLTFFQPLTGGPLQSAQFFYIPKGTKRLNLEVWDVTKSKQLTLYATPPNDPKPRVSRTIDIGERKVHQIPLQQGEDGTIARLDGRSLYFPVLYSVPMLWAKSPRTLLVPRAVAIADGLTILE